jgi:hypothetical protein
VLFLILEKKLRAHLTSTGNTKKEMEILLGHYKDVLGKILKRDIQYKTKPQIAKLQLHVKIKLK